MWHAVAFWLRLCGQMPKSRMATLDPGRLALRFAAKEAAIKAFDLSEAGIGWSQIEMTDCVGDAARIRLHGRAAESAARFGTYEIAVQSSQDDGMACAIVVALPSAGIATQENREKTHPHD